MQVVPCNGMFGEPSCDPVEADALDDTAESGLHREEFEALIISAFEHDVGDPGQPLVSRVDDLGVEDITAKEEFIGGEDRVEVATFDLDDGRSRAKGDSVVIETSYPVPPHRCIPMMAGRDEEVIDDEVMFGRPEADGEVVDRSHHDAVDRDVLSGLSGQPEHGVEYGPPFPSWTGSVRWGSPQTGRRSDVRSSVKVPRPDGGRVSDVAVESGPRTSLPVPPARSTSRVGALDGVRGLAALGVVVFHCTTDGRFLASLPSSMTFVVALLDELGNFCVAVFFLLSGYLLFREFVRRLLFDEPRTPLPHYFERRFLRIYPAYWVATIACVLVVGSAPVAGSAFGIFTLTERHFARSPVLLGLGVSWSLYIEVAFYVFLPLFSGLVWLGCRKRSTHVRLAVVLGSLAALVVAAHLWIGFVIAASPGDYRFRLNLPPFLGWFALGMALAVASVWSSSGRRLPAALKQMADRPWFCMMVVAAAFISIAIIQADFFGDSGRVLESTVKLQSRILLQGIAASFALLPFVLGDRPSRIRAAMNHRRLMWVGGVSFGIYLWHPIIIRIVMKIIPVHSDLRGVFVLLVTVLPASILVGWASFRLIEKPALSLAR